MRNTVLQQEYPAGTLVHIKDPDWLKGKEYIRPSHVPTYTAPQYEIVSRTNNGAYVLRDATGTILDRRVTLDQMKVVQGGIRTGSKKQHDDSSIYEVQKLVGHKNVNGRTKYLVKWKHWPDKYNTWEDYKDIIDTRLIRDYHNRTKTTADSDINYEGE